MSDIWPVSAIHDHSQAKTGDVPLLSLDYMSNVFPN